MVCVSATAWNYKVACLLDKYERAQQRAMQHRREDHQSLPFLTSCLHTSLPPFVPSYVTKSRISFKQYFSSSSGFQLPSRLPLLPFSDPCPHVIVTTLSPHAASRLPLLPFSSPFTTAVSR